MQKLIELYKSHFGNPPAQMEKLKGAGSNRQYYRMTAKDGTSVVGCIGTSKDEDRAFIYIANHFAEKRLPVPHILAVSDDEMAYIQTDLGDRSLFNSIRGGREAGGRYTLEERALIENTVRALPEIQIRGAMGMDFSLCYPQPEFNEENVLFDLNYFKYCFLKATELDFHELKLEADFHLLAKDLTAEDNKYFMYRDFQARNIMLDEEGNPYFIDFQGGRKGPFYYDLASFLWQASAKYSHKFRGNMVKVYYESLKNFIEVPTERHFVKRLNLFVLFRTLQVLGAYGFRGFFERKNHFIESIPAAIDNLRDLIKNEESIFPYPYLMDMLGRMTRLPQFAPEKQPVYKRKDGFKITNNTIYKTNPLDGPATYSKYDGTGPLVVRIYSFSFHKGIPADPTGNGGGYVFDCRSTHNPGRYEPYKRLTGLDEPVIRFLEDDGEILLFLKSVYQLADHHIKRYIQRGFTSLMFSFGCTGGQHRSVYAAQHLAEHVHEKFGIEVIVEHREQNIKQVMPATNEKQRQPHN